jgi:hypothetical protein
MRGAQQAIRAQVRLIDPRRHRFIDRARIAIRIDRGLKSLAGHTILGYWS